MKCKTFKYKAIKYMPKAARRKYKVRYHGKLIGSAETYAEAYQMLLSHAAEDWGDIGTARRYIERYFTLERK